MDNIDTPKFYERGHIKRVAEATDVSVETVRRVLNNLPGVALNTRQRVLEAAEKDKQAIIQGQTNQEELREAVADQQNQTAGIVAGIALAIDQLVVLRTSELLEPLQAELARLRARQGEWVDTQEALRLTGIKTSKTLRKVCSRPGSLIKVKHETGKPLYGRDSIADHNEHSTYRRSPRITD